jgi:uncharacterized cupredoxin-like copper-binding protein
MQTGSLSFTASASGTCPYRCPVPGNAVTGMVGTFIVN